MASLEGLNFMCPGEGKRLQAAIPILASGTIGIEVLGYDKLDNPAQKCGINYIEMFEGAKIFNQEIDKVNFGETRNIPRIDGLCHLKNSGDRFNKLILTMATV